jgi:hypothetical protein
MELASEASTYGRRPCSCWHHSAARETPPRRSRARMSEHWKEPTDPKRTRLEGNWVRLILRVTSSSTAASTELDLVVALVIRRVGRQRRVGAVRALALAILRGAGWVRRGQEAVDRHIRVLDGHAALQRERERPDRSTSADRHIGLPIRVRQWAARRRQHRTACGKPPSGSPVCAAQQRSAAPLSQVPMRMDVGKGEPSPGVCADVDRDDSRWQPKTFRSARHMPLQQPSARTCTRSHGPKGLPPSPPAFAR